MRIRNSSISVAVNILQDSAPRWGTVLPADLRTLATVATTAFPARSPASGASCRSMPGRPGGPAAKRHRARPRLFMWVHMLLSRRSCLARTRCGPWRASSRGTSSSVAATRHRCRPSRRSDRAVRRARSARPAQAASSARQYRAFREHQGAMRHADTRLWWWQAATGFALFFLAFTHLYTMLVNPEAIGPTPLRTGCGAGGSGRSTCCSCWSSRSTPASALPGGDQVGLARQHRASRAPPAARSQTGLTAFFLALGCSRSRVHADRFRASGPGRRAVSAVLPRGVTGHPS